MDFDDDDAGGARKTEERGDDGFRRRRSSSGGLAPVRRMLKLIVLGNAGVGKSSLLDRFVNKVFTGNYKATIGVDFLTHEVVVDEQIVTLQIWDTAGQERFNSLGPAFYRGANACVLVFDKTNSETFRALPTWKQEFMVHCAPNEPDSFPFVVLGNKSDLVHEAKVPRTVAEQWCKHEGIPYLETSARTNIQVQDAFMEVVHRALARAPLEEKPYIPDEFNITDGDAAPAKKSCCN